SREVPVIGPVPLSVVQIVAKTDRRERESDVVAQDMERVTPPSVAPHADIVQDLLEVQPDLQADLTLPLRRGGSRHIVLHPVGHGEEQIANRSDVEPKASGQTRELQTPRENVVALGGLHSSCSY